MSGAIHIAFKDLKKSRKEAEEKDTRIKELEMEPKNLTIFLKSPRCPDSRTS